MSFSADIVPKYPAIGFGISGVKGGGKEDNSERLNIQKPGS